MPRLSAASVEGLRSCIRPEYAGLPAEDLERIIESVISGIPSDTAEDFLSTLGSLGKTVVPVLQRAAPDVAQGAATGSTFGPWGAVIGAGAGFASSLLKSQAAPAAAAARVASPSPPAPPTSTTPQPTADPSATPSTSAASPSAPTLPTGQGAAATVLSLLQNPTVQQALMSQVLGSSGSQQVQTSSGTSIPRGAINAVLSQLLANASEALPESESISEQTYLRDASGEYLIDPASVDQHAALVLAHLQSRAPAPAGTETEDWFIDALPDSSGDWIAANESVEAVAFY